MRRHREVHVMAVAAEDDGGLESNVAAHFGRCPFYVVVVTEARRIRAARVVANPHRRDHGPGAMLGFLRNLGADIVVAGNVGPGATHRLGRFGIAEVTGATGRVVDAIGDLLGRGRVAAGRMSPVSGSAPRG